MGQDHLELLGEMLGTTLLTEIPDFFWISTCTLGTWGWCILENLISGLCRPSYSSLGAPSRKEHQIHASSRQKINRSTII